MPTWRYPIEGLNLDEIADKLVKVDDRLYELNAEGRGFPDDPEWSLLDNDLKEIGDQLHSDGGEEKMSAVLTLAQEKGLRNVHHVDQLWAGIRLRTA